MSSSPDVLVRYAAILLDGTALALVLCPSLFLAGTVTVVGKLALPTSLELPLFLKAVVTHPLRQAGRNKETHSKHWRIHHVQ